MRTIPHSVDGKSTTAGSSRTGEVFDLATGAVGPRSSWPSPPTSTRRSSLRRLPSRTGRTRRCRGVGRSCSASGSCSTPTSMSWLSSSPTSTATSSPTRSVRSSVAWRWSVSPAGSHSCSRVSPPIRSPRTSIRSRSGNRWASLRASLLSTSPPWSHSGCTPWRLRRATPSSSSRRSATPSSSLFIAEPWDQAGLPAGVFRVVNGDRVAVCAFAWEDRTEESFVQNRQEIERRLKARRSTSTGGRHEK